MLSYTLGDSLFGSLRDFPQAAKRDIGPLFGSGPRRREGMRERPEAGAQRPLIYS